MLLKRDVLDQIVDGSISLQFRRWKRPTVKAGGTLKTARGVLAIDDVTEIDESKITTKAAKQAGFASRDELLAVLNQRAGGAIYRVKLRYQGEDPRIALRSKATLSAEDVETLRTKLERFDRASNRGPWTQATLDVIRAQPATRAGDLAADLGMERAWFKTNVRKLKNLGLTESLGTGYRLSPRGNAFMKRMNW